jgi:ribosome assembly protein RRB1
LVGGTQIEKKMQNQLLVMRLSNMYSIADEKEVEEDSDDSDKEPDSDDEDAEKRRKAKEPILQVALIRHNGEVNRVKSQTIGPTEVCAVWNSLGKVQIWNLNNALEKLNDLDESILQVKLDNEKPLYSFDGHSAEGFALGWSPLKQGSLASGDRHKKIFVWQMSEGGKWHVNQRPLTGHTDSVEDVQWSHTEETLLISTSVDKSIRLWDTRAPAAQSNVCTVENAHDSDINVVSWNKYDPLLVTGSDDAQLKVWSLRNIQV